MANSMMALAMAALVKSKSSRRSTAAVAADADVAEKGHSAQSKTGSHSAQSKTGRALPVTADSGDEGKDEIAALHAPAITTQIKPTILPRVMSRTQREPQFVDAPAGAAAALSEGDSRNGSRIAAAPDDGRSQEAESVSDTATEGAAGNAAATAAENALDDQRVLHRPEEDVADQEVNHQRDGPTGGPPSAEVILSTAAHSRGMWTTRRSIETADDGAIASLDGAESMLSPPADIVMERPAPQQGTQRQGPASAGASAALSQAQRAAASARTSMGQALARSAEHTSTATGMATRTVIQPRPRHAMRTQPATPAATARMATTHKLPVDAPRHLSPAAAAATAVTPTADRTVVNRQSSVPAAAASGTVRSTQRTGAPQQAAVSRLGPGSGRGGRRGDGPCARFCSEPNGAQAGSAHAADHDVAGCSGIAPHTITAGDHAGSGPLARHGLLNVGPRQSRLLSA